MSPIVAQNNPVLLLFIFSGERLNYCCYLLANLVVFVVAVAAVIGFSQTKMFVCVNVVVAAVVIVVFIMLVIYNINIVCDIVSLLFMLLPVIISCCFILMFLLLFIQHSFLANSCCFLLLILQQTKANVGLIMFLLLFLRFLWLNTQMLQKCGSSSNSSRSSSLNTVYFM